MAVTLREDVSGRQIQRFVEDVLRTFYEWPLILPSDLVFFGRAAVLAEGIGHRYDPDFNAVAVARPAIARFAARAMGAGGIQETRARLVDWGQEAATAVRSLRELLRRIEREDFRIRWHPRDTMELQRFLAQQVRRGLLALLAFTIAVISALVWIGSRRIEILILGLLFSFGMFTVVFVLPSHLFQNPLRFRRRWPGR
jgi:predicted unusual protein kinase regulating ubiquinone biosynthesis (AarF/ABC1/UbiB family)